MPARILDARLGRGTILTEVVNDAVPAKYGEAVTEDNLAVLGQPEIEVTRIDDGDALEFTAEVDVRPEITLPAVGEVAVDGRRRRGHRRRHRRAGRGAAGAVRHHHRGRAARRRRRLWSPSTCAPRVDGEELAGRHRRRPDLPGRQPATWSTASTTPSPGLSAGESATFATALVAGELAGTRRRGHGHRQRRLASGSLPEVDDDFAQLASEFDTVEELRADLAEKIRRVKNLTQAAEARDKVLEALLAMTEVPAPAGASSRPSSRPASTTPCTPSTTTRRRSTRT